MPRLCLTRPCKLSHDTEGQPGRFQRVDTAYHLLTICLEQPEYKEAVCSSAMHATGKHAPAVGEPFTTIQPSKMISGITVPVSKRANETCNALTNSPSASASHLSTHAPHRSDHAEDIQFCARLLGLLPVARHCPGAASPQSLLTTALASVADGGVSGAARQRLAGSRGTRPYAILQIVAWGRCSFEGAK